MKFSEIEFDKIKLRGYDKTVVHREGKLIVGGKTAYTEIF